MEADAEAEAIPSKMVEAEAMLFEMIEAEAEAEAINSQICLLEVEAEAVQKSTASASLVSTLRLGLNLSYSLLLNLYHLFHLSDPFESRLHPYLI